MRRKRVIIGAVVLAALAAGVIVARFQETPAKATTATPGTATITIDPSVGETFAPPPPSAQPGVTAQAAWAQYAALNGSNVTTIPASVTVQLGLLTLPTGPAGAPGTSDLPTSNGESYTALNQLVYGYSWHQCPASTLTPPPANNPCIEWLFLDASTGQQIDQTWQQ
jgi:hypothetical protein